MRKNSVPALTFALLFSFPALAREGREVPEFSSLQACSPQTPSGAICQWNPAAIPVCTVVTSSGTVCAMPHTILRTPMSIQNPGDPTNWITVRMLGIWISDPIPGINYPADALRQGLSVKVDASYMSPSLGQGWTESAGFTLGAMSP